MNAAFARPDGAQRTSTRHGFFRACPAARWRSQLMFGSDYPHYESWFPHSIDKVLEWPSLGPDTRQKLFWDNANRCFRQT